MLNIPLPELIGNRWTSGHEQRPTFEHLDQSRNFHVDAPSSRLTRMPSIVLGSKFRALTPILLSTLTSTGSQCVMHPQVLHRTKLSLLSPQEYLDVEPGSARMRTSARL